MPNARAASVQGAALSDVVPTTPGKVAAVEAELRLKIDLLTANATLTGSSDDSGRGLASARVNELYLSKAVGGVQLSGGRRVVEWDVGFGFRPNDLVQQEPERRLLNTQLQGRTLLQIDRFGSDASASLVWVNPQHARDAEDRWRGGEESALAAMGYLRDGASDFYGFARLGEHTGASVGAAAVAVLSDSVAVHASARVLQRHDGWLFDANVGNGLATSNPWRQATLGHAGQWLVGATWTGQAKQSVLFEWWFDGVAPSNAQWAEWALRTNSLSALSAQAGPAGPTLPAPPTVPLAANLAWQDSPLSGLNQRRNTVLLRVSWQPEPWLFSLDTLYNPTDAGRIVTAGLQWQGDRVRLNAALRFYGGPSNSLAARVPSRQMGVLAASWSY